MKREMEIQQDNIEMLMKLTKDNPELKIIPMVNGELGGSDFSYWMGKWGKAEINEAYQEDERIYFRSYDEEELVEKQADFIFDSEFPTHTHLNAKESEAVTIRAKLHVENLEWEKVIVVKIEMPY